MHVTHKRVRPLYYRLGIRVVPRKFRPYVRFGIGIFCASNEKNKEEGEHYEREIRANQGQGRP